MARGWESKSVVHGLGDADQPRLVLGLEARSVGVSPASSGQISSHEAPHLVDDLGLLRGHLKVQGALHERRGRGSKSLLPQMGEGPLVAGFARSSWVSAGRCGGQQYATERSACGLFRCRKRVSRSSRANLVKSSDLTIRGALAAKRTTSTTACIRSLPAWVAWFFLSRVCFHPRPWKRHSTNRCVPRFAEEPDVAKIVKLPAAEACASIFRRIRFRRQNPDPLRRVVCETAAERCDAPPRGCRTGAKAGFGKSGSTRYE